MTDAQINQAIAEACGIVGKSGEIYKTPDGWVGNCPQFCTDLNAMAEAEKTLTKEQVREYQCYMYDMACEVSATQGKWMPYSATSRYRAEAFLRALGKWEEVQE